VPLLAALSALAALAGCAADSTLTAPSATARLERAGTAAWVVNTVTDHAPDGQCDARDCTLREALALAPAAATINFAASVKGTIALDAELGALVLTKAVSVRGPGMDVLAISGEDRVRVLRILPGVGPVTVRGLTLTRGRGGADVWGGFGGAVLNQGVLQLEGVRVSASSAENGGGIGNYLERDEPHQLTLVESVVSGNRARDWGGGIVHFNWRSASVTILRSTIAGNTSGDAGGGLHAFGGSVVEIAQSTISGNTAWNGGGVFVESGWVTLTSTTVTANRGANSAGGITTTSAYSPSAGASVRNSIVAGNVVGPPGTTTAGDALYCSGSGGPWEFRSDGYNVLGAITNRCAENGVGAPPFAAAPTDRTVAAGQVFSTVLSATLAANGGPTPTHALLAGGPAIDAGACLLESMDQRRLSRPVDVVGIPNASFGGCDIGSFEWRPESTGGRGGGKP
jgi:CSLREA domain-containing protein